MLTADWWPPCREQCQDGVHCIDLRMTHNAFASALELQVWSTRDSPDTYLDALFVEQALNEFSNSNFCKLLKRWQDMVEHQLLDDLVTPEFPMETALHVACVSHGNEWYIPVASAGPPEGFLPVEHLHAIRHLLAQLIMSSSKAALPYWLRPGKLHPWEPAASGCLPTSLQRRLPGHPAKQLLIADSMATRFVALIRRLALMSFTKQEMSGMLSSALRMS